MQFVVRIIFRERPTLTFIRKLNGVSKPRDLRLGVRRYFTLEQNFLAAVDLLDGGLLVKNWTPAKLSAVVIIIIIIIIRLLLLKTRNTFCGTRVSVPLLQK